MRTFLALDGGGTKSLCLVADDRGRILGHGAGGGANVNLVPETVARRSIRDAVETAWAAAGVPAAPQQAVISGPVISLTQAIIAETTGALSISRVSESEAAWNSVRPWLARDYDLPLDTAVMIDAGTGSTAGGRNQAGQHVGVGGWGWLLGDEGSGFWIGLKAVQAAIQAQDGRGPSTMLLEGICAHLNLTSLHELIPRVYQSKRGVRQIASLGPLVSELARRGDEQSQAILAVAGYELARMVNVIVLRLGIGKQAFAVIPFGSVFKAGDVLLTPFRTAVLKVAPRAQVVLPRYESVVGTLLVAMQRGDIPTAQVWSDIERALADVKRIQVTVE
ncbi:MAG: BadF/BadG/BcrA/BcrD ATPase family protein [Anaerolineae bacterium]